MNSSVSIIIPAYNAVKTIERSIQAARSQEYPALIEIVVVDDGSVDATAKVVKSFDRVSYLYQANAGPAAARNLGAGASRGAIIFFTDSDCIAHPDWLQRILPHFAHPQVAAVCGSYGIANPAEILASCVHAEIIFRHKRIPAEPKVFGSYNVAIRRDVFEKLGGFSLNYRHASGEDNDLSYRMLQAGYKIRFEPLALVDHFHPTRVRIYLREQFRHGFWRARIYLDHPRMSRGDDYTFWKDALEVAITFIIAGVLLLELFYVATSKGQNIKSSFGSQTFDLFKPLDLVLAMSLIFLCLLEIAFACRIVNSLRQRVFFAGVMFLRAFSRSAGFACGIARFLPSKMRLK